MTEGFPKEKEHFFLLVSQLLVVNIFKCNVISASECLLIYGSHNIKEAEGCYMYL